MINNAKVATYRNAIESNTNNAKQIWANLRDLCPRDKARAYSTDRLEPFLE